ncbi:MAG: sugar transferase [Bacteroidetes bacterium]|nr:sugar transferase [Bacteroidota bacterium]
MTIKANTMAIQSEKDSSWLIHAKRAVDLLAAITAGFLLLPVFFLLVLLIRFGSPGPALYSQMRVGRHGRLFRIWKFRTMYIDADERLDSILKENPAMHEEWQTNQKLKRDPRLTPVGVFLRKFSIDETPQLWNIIIGDMSIVGPRPCTEEQIPLYGEVFYLYTRVRPGLTGLWQVSGRNNTTYAERVRLDADYIQNWSILLDTFILFKTIWVVLKQDGAY